MSRSVICPPIHSLIHYRKNQGGTTTASTTSATTFSRLTTRYEAISSSSSSSSSNCNSRRNNDNINRKKKKAASASFSIDELSSPSSTTGSPIDNVSASSKALAAFKLDYCFSCQSLFLELLLIALIPQFLIYKVVIISR